MAHSGKIYPVHFRRDLNTNSRNNSTGFAKAYGLTSENAQGDVGSRLAGRRWLCIAVDERTYPGLHYVSDYQTIAGRDIRFELVGDQNTWNANPAMLGEIRDRLLGHLGSFGNGYGTSGRYESGTGSYRFFDEPHPELFRVISPTIVSTGAVRWAEWNAL